MYNGELSKFSPQLHVYALNFLTFTLPLWFFLHLLKAFINTGTFTLKMLIADIGIRDLKNDSFIVKHIKQIQCL